RRSAPWCGRAASRGARWRRRSAIRRGRRRRGGVDPPARWRARSPSFSDRRSPLALLAQDPLVPDAQGDPLLVEPLGEGNGELAALPGQLLETLGVDRPVRGEVREEPIAQFVEGPRSEPQLIAHLAGAACRGQRLEP